MRYTVLAYKDKELEKFLPAFLIPNNFEDSIEIIIDGVKKGKLEGADALTVYHLGFYDTEDGKFDLLEDPKKVFDCDQYVKQG